MANRLLLVAAVLACSGYLVYALAPLKQPASSAEAQYFELSAKFRQFHQDQTNIFFHLITTPLGVLSVMSLVNKISRTTFIVNVVAVVYAISLADKLPPHILALTSLASGGIAVAAQSTMHLSWLQHLFMFLVGYFGQDAAHYFTGEQTFQSSYQQQQDFLQLLAEHTYYLLPLVFDSTMPTTEMPSTASTSWMAVTLSRVLHLMPMVVVFAMQFVSKDGAMTFPWQFQRSRVLMVKLTEPQDVKDLAAIRAWAMAKGPSTKTSTHWWFRAPKPETPASQCLEQEPKDAFDRIAKCKTITDLYKNRFGAAWTVDVLEGMNEVYVSSPSTVKGTSDQVFYTKHIDGPYYYVPFASQFRMIIGTDENEEITTKFPMVPTECAAKTGDVLTFDFHREIHYIQKNEGISNKDFRIVLKVHHCVYPKWATPFGLLLGWLSTRYNMAFRSLFLYTINPNSLWERFSAFNVVFWTVVVEQLEAKLGYSNIGYLLTLGLMGYFIDYKIFLIGTSFVHYLRYINTYYHREGCAYGNFKRDALIYKTLALTQLAFWYTHSVTKGFTDIQNHGIGIVDAAMVVGGYALSAYTTAQLGVDGTYFGIELGFVKATKNYVQKFPYGVIPHPMILSQCVAMCGFYKHEAFRAAWPYLVPAHVCLYLTHMVQEHFDIYAAKYSQKNIKAA